MRKTQKKTIQITKGINPFEYLNDIFNGNEVEDYSGFNSYLLNYYLSYSDVYFPANDLLNKYVFYLPRDLFYKLMVVFFKGPRCRVDYLKKEKKIDLLEEFKMRVKKYYGWSSNELGHNFLTLLKNVELNKLISDLAFTDSEKKSILKILD